MKHNKILYIYGYGSNSKDSSTMKVVKDIVEKMGYELISVEYNQLDPCKGLAQLEDTINQEEISYVIGHSLGGFFALCLDKVKQLVINPCMNPCVELPKIDPNIPKETIAEYKKLYDWLNSGNETPWVYQLEDVMGLFGDHDELFSYYNSFKCAHPMSYYINAGHRPTTKAFTDEITSKIRTFLS